MGATSNEPVTLIASYGEYRNMGFPLIMLKLLTATV